MYLVRFRGCDCESSSAFLEARARRALGARHVFLFRPGWAWRIYMRVRSFSPRKFVISLHEYIEFPCRGLKAAGGLSSISEKEPGMLFSREVLQRLDLLSHSADAEFQRNLRNELVCADARILASHFAASEDRGPSSFTKTCLHRRPPRNSRLSMPSRAAGSRQAFRSDRNTLPRRPVGTIQRKWKIGTGMISVTVRLMPLRSPSIRGLSTRLRPKMTSGA